MSTDPLKREDTILNNNNTNNNNNNNNNFTENLKKELSETMHAYELIEAFLCPPDKRLHQTGLDLEKHESDYKDFYSVEISL
jgi:hypothetical protein